MKEYKCECCNFSTINKTKYERHMNTKKHINVLKSHPENTKKSPSSHPQVTMQNDCKKFICKYCNSRFKYKQGMYRHIKYTCKKNVDEDLKELVLLMNEKLENMNTQMKQQEKTYLKQQILLRKEIEARDKKISKLSQKLQINNNCIVNQNTIQLLNYKDTDISHLTQIDYINSLKRQNNCVKTLTEKIHYNPNKPENMNIYISNLKNDYVTVYENGRWELKKDFDNFYEHKEILLEEWIRDEQDNYPELRDKFEKYLDNKEKDNILNNIKEDIKLMMYNNRKRVEDNNKYIAEPVVADIPDNTIKND